MVAGVRTGQVSEQAHKVLQVEIGRRVGTWKSITIVRERCSDVFKRALVVRQSDWRGPE